MPEPGSRHKVILALGAYGRLEFNPGDQTTFYQTSLDNLLNSSYQSG
jgi:hypothetical protein